MNVFKEILLILAMFVFTIVFSSNGSNESWSNNIASGEKWKPIVFIPEKTHDFGEIPEDSEVSHIFTIKNIGTGIMQIYNIEEKG